MKKLVLLLTAAVIGHQGFAQISVDPEIGMNFSNMRTKIERIDAMNTDAKLGFKVGAGVQFNLHEGFYLKPGIYYNMLGDEMEVARIKSSNTLHYLSLPVNLGYNYAISEKAGGIFLEAGPQIGYALAGNTKVSGLGEAEQTTDIEFGSEDHETNPFDWGFNFALGFETPWGVYVKGSYGLGLGNLSNVTDTKITNNNWNVSLGYRIKL